MSHQPSFNQIKKTILTLLDHPITAGDVCLNTADNINYDLIYKERIEKLFTGFRDIANAIDLNDQQEIHRALLQAKLRAMSLTSFFTALEDDCISLLLHYPPPSLSCHTSATDEASATHSRLPPR
ncbi:hypothetical protein SJI19_08265 [Acerihabitans sp. TG2]|uniref:hypothetical protein n=1 Tax=Acerihabitans sp. TG2 TaxID=3096008 RepID=UPI002B23C7E6|nr:hypothetical protein [Acerihabitans sp. TG2]MEA9390534.1 hypothetical protein [Acerihabitans sp. TG2]